MLSAANRGFIQFMMSADALRFGQFKTKSGRLTPYFVNTGNYKTEMCIRDRYSGTIWHWKRSPDFSSAFFDEFKQQQGRCFWGQL